MRIVVHKSTMYAYNAHHRASKKEKKYNCKNVHTDFMYVCLMMDFLLISKKERLEICVSTYNKHVHKHIGLRI